MLTNPICIRGVAFCDCLPGWSLDANTGLCHRDRLPCPGPEAGVWLGGGCHAPPCGPGMTLWGEEGAGACLPLDSGEAFTTRTQERAGVLMEEVSPSCVLKIFIGVFVLFLRRLHSSRNGFYCSTEHRRE